MRYKFIADLVEELAGPRKGPVEILPIEDNPKDEYCTAQLFPPDSDIERSPEEEESLGTSAGGGEEDAEDGPASLVNQAFIDAGQNFRRIPSSMGLSFVLKSRPKKDDFKVCLTWARYSKVDEDNWQRIPKIWIDSYDEIHDRQFSDGSLRLTYRVSDIQEGAKISIYVSSSLQCSTKGRPRTEDIIFQPEIRVILKDPDSKVELGDMGFHSEDSEWKIATKQYEKLKVYARGHLCGAYWKEIDPQREDKRFQVERIAPFKWTDGDYHKEKGERIDEFFSADFRTDFLPMYPGPTSAARSKSSSFDADDISMSASFKDLEAKINPLLEEYEQWIKGQNPADEIDREIISRHHEALGRMRSSLSFLGKDMSAFSSFLFMNKAMSKQYAWSGRRLSWKPFQLAFILLSLESTVREEKYRNVCDTIWFPTGGGKTEAYLGLAAFAIAYRRSNSKADSQGNKSGEGTCVLSRYTLRLLTIQQFRRALKVITACEVLRCSKNADGSVGWLPKGSSSSRGFVWGRSPFSIGLWVGSRVTPNALRGEGFGDIQPGAIHLLKRPAQNDESDPAQIIECPCCSTILSLPSGHIGKDEITLRLFVGGKPRLETEFRASLSTSTIEFLSGQYDPHPSGKTGYFEMKLKISPTVTPRELNNWWIEKAEGVFSVNLHSLNVTRPGYVGIESGRRGSTIGYEIRCPNSKCELNTVEFKEMLPARSGEWDYVEVHPLFSPKKDPTVSLGLRISAITVDESLEVNPTSMVISTCDKLAQMAFSNKAAAIFGRVRSFELSKGFSQAQPSGRRIPVENFSPPSLIIQDELHLLEGPLGSTFGLYETAIESLCSNPKYIASSATIRNSKDQIACLMGKDSRIFPPVNLEVTDGFFLNAHEIHPLDETSPGRLFLGVAVPGRAPETPMLRLWGRLLQTAQDLRRSADIKDLDHFWTLIGYFNAVRELARGETLIRQDIPQFLDKLKRQNPESEKRSVTDGFRNLSSQTTSSELPGILAQMERSLVDGDPLNSVATTSMFGTGVDVSRLSLMVVHGQPKSASQYIQAVGRIGRSRAGLAVVFFRVSKPRDLNHYEYFTGYHRKLPIAVEPITVKPLAPKALDRTLGPLLAIFIRNWRNDSTPLPENIDDDLQGHLIQDVSESFVEALLAEFSRKWDAQPQARRWPSEKKDLLRYVKSQLEKWQEYARLQTNQNQTLPYKGNHPVVVLGTDDKVRSVFSRVPQSLREVEPTISIFTGRD